MFGVTASVKEPEHDQKEARSSHEADFRRGVSAATGRRARGKRPSARQSRTAWPEGMAPKPRPWDDEQEVRAAGRKLMSQFRRIATASRFVSARATSG